MTWTQQRANLMAMYDATPKWAFWLGVIAVIGVLAFEIRWNPVVV